MSTSKKGSTEIRYDEFIKLIRPDPANSDPIVLLFGYVGESGSDDRIRLYSDASLAEYADIPKADIVHSLPAQDDPLGGSQLWVKQSANVTYTDPNAYAQGDMYSNYMNTTYSPGAESMGGGAITLNCTISPVCTRLTNTTICRPSRFVCPTPVTRYIICDIKVKPPVQVTLSPACNRASWVDGCPSALGCTIDTRVINPVDTRAINPGIGGYAGGDMYNEYMQNMYEPGYENMGGGGVAAAVTNGTQCYQVASARCYFSVAGIACRTFQVWKCLTPITRQIPYCPPVTCIGITRRPPISLAGCPSDFCGGIPGGGIDPRVAGGGQFESDYTGGDMYNDYMQNSYEPGGYENYGPGNTRTPICVQPLSLNGGCVTLAVICRRTIQVWRCGIQTRTPSVCIRCYPDTLHTTRTFPSAVDGCPSALGCTIDPGNIRTQRFEGDYAGGDMYNEYMANDYAPDANAATAAANPAITIASVCNPHICTIITTPFRCITQAPPLCWRPTLPITRCCRTRTSPVCTLSPFVCNPTRICDIGF